MTLAWVAYAVVVSVLLGLAASFGESALRRVGRPVRWVWAGSILGSLLLPLASWRGWFAGPGLLTWSLPGVGGAPEYTGEVMGVAEVAGGVGADLSAVASGSSSPPSSPVWQTLLSERLILVVGLISTVAVVLLVLNSVRSLRRARAQWRPEVVEGIPVLVSATIGPAALGVLRGAIVIPEWVLTLEGRFRRLLLLHEEEHLRAGDPRVLLAGLLAVAILPWNPALWWQFRRLSQALELDCDARVLSREPDPRNYGLLLLEVGRRPGRRSQLLPAFGESRSLLERRIRMLGQAKLGSSRVRVVGSMGAALLLVLMACEARRPAPLESTPGGTISNVTQGTPRPLWIDRQPESLTISNFSQLEETPGCKPQLLVNGESITLNPGRTPGTVTLSIRSETIDSVEVRRGSGCGSVVITTKDGKWVSPWKIVEPKDCHPLVLLNGVLVERGKESYVLSTLPPERETEMLTGSDAVKAVGAKAAYEYLSCGVMRITTKDSAGSGS